MLASILVLTKYLGVYSYMIGLAASFVITGILNLRLLKKQCPGIKFMKYMVHALIVVTASCAFGMLLDGIVSNYVSVVWQMVICAPACLAFTGAFLYCLEMFTFHPLKKLISKT